MRVLVLAAHPDDELLGLGGTLAKHREAGDELTAVILSEGASARYASGTDAVLRSAAQAAAKLIGIGDLRFLGLADQKLDQLPIIDVIRPIEEVVAAVRPDVVYGHHWGDINRDHRVVAEATFVACRPPNPFRPGRLYCFETPSSTEWSVPDSGAQFVPNYFVDISATVEVKLRAMACYETELRPAPHPRSLESLRTRAQYWGQVVNRPYAEAFVLAREIA